MQATYYVHTEHNDKDSSVGPFVFMEALEFSKSHIGPPDSHRYLATWPAKENTCPSANP